MPLAEMMILRNLTDNRKHKLQEEQAQQYLEGVSQEENVLVDVTQGFNTSIVYKALLQQSKSANIYDGRHARELRKTGNIQYNKMNEKL